MSLKFIVPTLGLMAATITPATAAEVGGLTIGGYVDAILEIVSYDDNNAPGVDADGNPDDLEIDFTAAAQLEVSYAIGDAVSANVELYYADGADSLTLEQANVEWAVNEQISVAAGRFHNHLGWEGLDAPELYRINTSTVFGAMTGVDVDGVAIGIQGGENVEVGLYLVDSFFFGEDDAPATKEAADVALGAALTVGVEGVGSFDFDLAYDIGASADEDGDAADIIHFGVNATVDALQESNNLLFGIDFMYQDWDAVSTFGAMFLANYGLSSDTPASITFALGYHEPNDDADDDEQIEVAIALLTNPTSDENFALNVEGRYLSEAADDSDEFGIFVEALAVIP